MRVLLTDGSGLTSRQVANRLFASGHVVEALTPDPFCICRFTRHVHRLRRVPAYGSDPFAWLEVALAAYGAGEFDVLFPTQEQVAVLASVPNRLQATGVVTAVPPWTALLAVQDKVSAFTTLQRLGVPQPPASTEPAGWDAYPAFVKIPIGTASGGVTRVVSAAELARACSGHPHVLVQLAVAGPLAMCQSVFDHGSLVAFHANLRTGEGANGGASHKSSIALLKAARRRRAARPGPPLARSTVGRRDRHEQGAAVHRHQPAARRARERLACGRRPCRYVPRRRPGVTALSCSSVS